MNPHILGALLDYLVMAVVCLRLAGTAAHRLGHLGHLRQAGRLALARITTTIPRHPRDAAVPGRRANEVQA